MTPAGEDKSEGGMRAFADLGLARPLLRAVADQGFEVPTPIQRAAIPALLAGRDVIGQAQTGSGKTAAYGLPLLGAVDATTPQVQAVVLCPTRELAIQVADALAGFAAHLRGLEVLPLYGGQPMEAQIDRLKQGVHVVVGTPGRVADHLGRGTLSLDHVRWVTLDEADQMLELGFVESVETILERVPAERQSSLFSATLPEAIRRIASRALKADAAEFLLDEAAPSEVDQRVVVVTPGRRLEALARLLETEDIQGALVFARTRIGCGELARRLQDRGLPVEAIHGEMSQPHREVIVRRLRQGDLDVVVATDVAARGLDVGHLSHVFNYDPPGDAEIYTHRIGRTGRAGRRGTSILFLTPRERELRFDLERATGHTMTPLAPPEDAQLLAARRAELKARVQALLGDAEALAPYQEVAQALASEGAGALDLAAAALALASERRPLVLEPLLDPEDDPASGQTVRFLVTAGRRDGLRHTDIIGAFANEGDLPGRAVRRVELLDRETLVDIPRKYAKRVAERMASTWMRGKKVEVRVVDVADGRFPSRIDPDAPPPRRKKGGGKGRGRGRGRGGGGKGRGRKR